MSQLKLELMQQCSVSIFFSLVPILTPKDNNLVVHHLLIIWLAKLKLLHFVNNIIKIYTDRNKIFHMMPYLYQLNYILQYDQICVVSCLLVLMISGVKMPRKVVVFYEWEEHDVVINASIVNCGIM